jgi:hypothetical protein
MDENKEVSIQELEPEKIFFNVAETEEDKLGRLKVVTERYGKEGYLEDIKVHESSSKISDLLEKGGISILEKELQPGEFQEFLEHGILVHDESGQDYYIDKYTWNSVPFVAKQGGEYVGSARMIVRNGFNLPTLSDPTINIDENWKDTVKDCKVEFSQFAVKKGSPAGVSIGLLRAAHIYSRDVLKISDWVATIDDRVVRLLNSNFFHFELPQIGPGVLYLGSLSIPVLVNFEKALENAEKHENSKNMAQFIRGNDVEGFDWYSGK